MLRFHFNLSPNPAKVGLLLEELGLPYEAVPVDTRRGDQHSDAYRALNPNGKTPVIEDGDVVVFDSNAILLYLAEKHGRFLPPPGDANRGALLSWLMFVATGVGPFGGQAVHFQHFAPEKVPYAIERYRWEAKRHFGILNDRLAKHRYMLGDEYTIVDMAAWGWCRVLGFMLGAEAWGDYPHLKRLFDEINARPAAAKVDALKEKHAFKAEMDEDARRQMFKHIGTAA